MNRDNGSKITDETMERLDTYGYMAMVVSLV